LKTEAAVSSVTLAHSSTVNMEATGSSETLVHCYTQKMATAGLSENLARSVLELEAAGSNVDTLF
jgi:hypothetical protein